MVWPFRRKGAVHRIGRAVHKVDSALAAAWGEMSPGEREIMRPLADRMQALHRALISVQQRSEGTDRLGTRQLGALRDRTLSVCRIPSAVSRRRRHVVEPPLRRSIQSLR